MLPSYADRRQASPIPPYHPCDEVDAGDDCQFPDGVAHDFGAQHEPVLAGQTPIDQVPSMASFLSQYQPALYPATHGIIPMGVRVVRMAGMIFRPGKCCVHSVLCCASVS